MKTFFIPDYVKKIITQLNNSGYQAWCVGGCVRDILLGKNPSDYDIASDAPCEEIHNLFDRVIDTGIKHGTVTVLSEGNAIEITRYRIDGEYTDCRRPDSVTFTGEFRQDLARRDFTINAMGYNPKLGFFDPFGGQADLENGIIRAVGDPNKRFSEDALRIMRAVRFASVLGFEIESKTLCAAAAGVPLLENISAERIASELFKTLSGLRPSLLKIICERGGLLRFGIADSPELNTIDCIPRSQCLRFAALCRLCGAKAFDAASLLKLSRAVRAEVSLYQSDFDTDSPKTKSDLKRKFQKIPPEHMKDLLRAREVLLGEDNSLPISLVDEAASEPYLLSHLKINGNDIKRENPDVSEKEIGRILKNKLEQVISDPTLNTHHI